ncbi:MAG: S66 peptidase family protein [Gemmatimonadaceae bacterium]
MRRPPLLVAGARIALVAPAGPLAGIHEVQRGIANIESLGWVPSVGAHLLERTGYLAGSDDLRLSDLNLALADDDVDGIWCARGGYGTMRLLDRIDFGALRRRPKAVIGFSDITALHSAIGINCEIVSFHGPNARFPLTPFSRGSLERATRRGEDPCGEARDSKVIRAGRARGRLAGGNLAILAALAGTSFARQLDGAILVIEDVHESVYRIDRMLQQLRLAGLLERCNGIVAGHFTSVPEEQEDAVRGVDDVLSEIAHEYRVPCLAGAPIGHVDDQWTIPLGAAAELDTEARVLRVPSLYAL